MPATNPTAVGGSAELYLPEFHVPTELYRG